MDSDRHINDTHCGMCGSMFEGEHGDSFAVIRCCRWDGQTGQAMSAGDVVLCGRCCLLYDPHDGGAPAVFRHYFAQRYPAWQVREGL